MYIVCKFKGLYVAPRKKIIECLGYDIHLQNLTQIANKKCHIKKELHFPNHYVGYPC